MVRPNAVRSDRSTIQRLAEKCKFDAILVMDAPVRSRKGQSMRKPVRKPDFIWPEGDGIEPYTDDIFPEGEA